MSERASPKGLNPQLIQVIRLLQENPQGMSVQNIARALAIHRNSAAKYLSILQLLGKVDLRLHGKSKIYRISQRLPFDAILQSYPDDYIIGLNKSLQVIAINPSLAEDIEISGEQFLGKNLSDIPGTGLLTLEVLDAIRKGVRGEEHISLQEVTLENTRLPFIMKLVPTVFTSGMIGVAVILIRYYGNPDNSERDYYRKKAEYWENCYLAAIRDRDEYIVRSLPDGKILSVNEPYARILDRLPEQLAGTRQSHLIPREERNRLKKHFSSLTPESPLAAIEHRVILPDGTLHWVAWKNRAVYHEGKLVEIISTGHDITRERLRELQLKKYEDSIDEIILEKTGELAGANRQLLQEIKEAEERESVLRSREEYYRSLLETLTKGMWLFSPPRSTGVSSMPVAKMLEFPEDRFRGKSVIRVPGQPARDSAKQDSGIPEFSDRSGAGLDLAGLGETFGVQGKNASRFLNAPGQHSGILDTPPEFLNARNPVTLMTDIRKYMLLDRITRHDILNQLMVLQGYLHLSLERLEDPKTAAMVEKGLAASENIGKMIRFSRECQEIGLHAPRWQNISRIIENVLTTLDHAGVSVFTGAPALEVLGDPLLEKVFYNLIENSLRHGGKVTEIRVSWSECRDGILLVCEDDGNGISPDEKEKIFACGYGRNTGYGMFFTREILETTGFTIRERGIPGQGAKFEIAVPAGKYRFVHEPRAQGPENP